MESNVKGSILCCVLFYTFFYTLLGSVNLMINFYYILYPAE